MRNMNKKLKKEAVYTQTTSQKTPCVLIFNGFSVNENAQRVVLIDALSTENLHVSIIPMQLIVTTFKDNR